MRLLIDYAIFFLYNHVATMWYVVAFAPFANYNYNTNMSVSV